MRVLIAMLALVASAGPALACGGGGETVLNCTARGGQKAIRVCLQGDYVTYAYGPRGGAAELELAEPVTRVEHRPWSGVGRSIWEATTFRNQGYAYEAWISVDRMAEGAPRSGGVTVLKGGQTLATIECDRGSAEIGIWAISDAKQARGLCWDPGRATWAACTN